MVEYYRRRSVNEPLEKVNKPQTIDGLWINIFDNRIDTQKLAEDYNLDANIIRDVMDKHELPRCELKDGNIYTFIRTPLPANNIMSTGPVLMVANKNNVITISRHVHLSSAEMEDYITAGTSEIGSLATSILAYVVAEYEKKVRELVEKVVNARIRLRKHEVKNADFIEFVEICDCQNEYFSSLKSIKEVIKQLRYDYNTSFTTHDMESLDDIILHIQQLLTSITSNVKTVTSIQSAYSTISNNILNQRMKTLTTITILLAVPNVIYGMYGMNVSMPFQNEWWAYPGIMCFTLLLILLVYSIAKRLRLF